jgi:pseudaminic acid synthase
MSNKTIKINNRLIGDDFSPYIIAEMSANHNGSFENALKIISAAATAGADAIKIQTYTAETLTLKSDKSDFVIKGGLWDGLTLYELYESAYTPWDWHKPLFDHAKSLDITIFSSPFDTTAVDLLEDLNAPAYKIASFEAIDLDLIKYTAATKKPLIISTGMANDIEIQEAIDTALANGTKELAILHCVSGYPAPADNYNLKTIPDMKNRFNLITGLSDHTLDNTTAIASVAIGARIIEKHFTLDRNGGGPDDSFSMEPSDLRDLVSSSKIAFSAIGEVNYGLKSSEIGNIKFRRSLYFIKDIKAGTIISENHVKSVRPGYGIAPKYLSSLIGSSLTEDVKRYTPVKPSQFEEKK